MNYDVTVNDVCRALRHVGFAPRTTTEATGRAHYNTSTGMAIELMFCMNCDGTVTFSTIAIDKKSTSLPLPREFKLTKPQMWKFVRRIKVAYRLAK